MTDVRRDRGRVFAQEDGRVAPKNPRGPAESLKTKDRRVDDRGPPTTHVAFGQTHQCKYLINNDLLADKVGVEPNKRL